MKVIRDLCKHHEAEFLENTPIAPYTTFRIGGNCNIIKVNNVELLCEVLKHCHSAEIPWHIIGRGSNILISDAGLSGVVILVGDDFSKVCVENDVSNANNKILRCEAGARLSEVCKIALTNNLTGFEFAYGIPGTVGGALCMNAGAYGGEMSDVVESCTFIDVNQNDCIPQNLSRTDMNLSYRNSCFDNNSVITEVCLRLKQVTDDSSVKSIKYKMDEITNARREKQPLEFPSAGSTFKRTGHPIHPYAAKLIDDCGLKGKSVGGAMVSEKHAGFIINTGNATFDDVIALIEIVQAEVLKSTGIKLETEVKIWRYSRSV
ncbi:MAG: UDP-N-acetylmuramate dehydrogenase [Oscillospiraceae bacterium]|nr:UDP-N-acetylmuramate dehydrogenase [Oscillospiraceae bacterium]